MREPVQRRRIRPVRVVHGDHQRAARREVRDQPVQAVHGGERNVVLDRSGAGPVEHARGEPGRAVQERVPLPGPGRHADRLDELAGDAIRKAALQGQPAGGEDPHAEFTRAAAGHAEQGGLADPGGSFHQHEGAVSRLGSVGCGQQHCQFRVAFEYHLLNAGHGRPRNGNRIPRAQRTSGTRAPQFLMAPRPEAHGRGLDVPAVHPGQRGICRAGQPRGRHAEGARPP